MVFATLSPLITLSLESGIVFLAFFVQGFSGFGAGLIMTPLLAFFLDLQRAVVISVLLQLAAGVFLLLRGTIKACNYGILRAIIPPSCLACLLGVYALMNFNFNILLLLLGTIVLFTLRYLVNPSPHETKHLFFSTSTLIGIASGLLQGLFGTGGPPLVFFLKREIPTRATLRATLLIYFQVLDVLLACAYLLAPAQSGARQLADIAIIKLGLILITSTSIGYLGGYILQKYTSEQIFRISVTVIAILASLFLILKTLRT